MGPLFITVIATANDGGCCGDSTWLIARSAAQVTVVEAWAALFPGAQSNAAGVDARREHYIGHLAYFAPRLGWLLVGGRRRAEAAPRGLGRQL